jgi:uncharacterized protein (TIGR02217 family)
MSIPAYRLPEHIERGSGFGPMFKNVIQEAIAGNEQRFAQWTHCRGVGDISYGLLKSDDVAGDFAAILALWRAHFGSLYPFRFKDWSDYIADDELFGTGDGSETEFQLVKTYDPSQILLNTPGSLFYVRSISLLATAPVIEVNGVTKTVTTDYTIANGLETFTSPPAVGHPITWSGEFDIPVRFDMEQLPVIMNEGDLVALRSMPIKEVIGES